ncbi:MAG: translation initiation factor IF-2 associated domain-containing protein, partial [Comamonas sp.]|nr:translation initiation factor IF-2 associated domain-containing protein [Comamonas sp.]
MSSNTVAEFASELKKTPEVLLEQLKSAGVVKSSPADALTEADKQKLLAHLQASHGVAQGDRKKITLVTKSTTEIKQADATGKARTIQVEVRKKRTFVKRDEAAEAAQAPVPEAKPEQPDPEQAELARREEEARHQAELIRRQEEELAAQRLEREDRERREREAAERAAAYAAEEAAKKAQASAAKQEATREQEQEAAARAAAQAEARAKADAEAKARAADESARAKDLEERRRKALEEAAAIRSMMSTPAKVLVAKKPEEPKPAARAAAAEPKKGTLHKPANTPAAGAGRTAGGAATAGAGAGAGGKEVKSAKLSSSWAGEPGKKKEIKTRGDTTGGSARGSAWRAGGPKGGGRRGDRDRSHDMGQAAVAEVRTLEVHVPETITVAELAHKMSI